MKGTSASDDRSAISTPMGASPLARRIGPSYTIDDIALKHQDPIIEPAAAMAQRTAGAAQRCRQSPARNAN